MQATHIVGGDMTYRCLGNDQYEITMVFRRDCDNGADDAPLDDPAIFGIFDNFGALQVNLGDSLGRQLVTYQSRQIINADVNENCIIGNPGSLCVEEAIYRDTLHLPYNKIGYYIAYQRCCRNIILNNIDNPLEIGSTYYVHIQPNAALECNTQPVFKDWADIYICEGQPFSFDHSAMDADGDEIVYKLCDPSLGASFENPHPSVPSRPPYNTITWANGYSIDNMFGSGSPLMINSSTGQLSATPQQTGTYLVGICMEEYRNGELLSTVRRDFEINVVACSDPITIIECDIAGTDCNGGTTVSFNLQTTNADSYQWYFDYPNTDPAFTSTTQSPTFSYPAPGIYTVRMEATRSSDGCTRIKDTVINVGGISLKQNSLLSQ